MKITKQKLKQIIKEEMDQMGMRQSQQPVQEVGEHGAARDLYEQLLEAMGAETLLQELMQAMDEGEAMANLEHIAQAWDIQTDGGLDDEDEDYDDLDTIGLDPGDDYDDDNVRQETSDPLRGNRRR